MTLAEAKHQDATQRRLVLIDEDEDLGELLGVLLRAAGYIVEGHLSGADGVAAVDRLRPHLVIVERTRVRRDGDPLIPAIRAVTAAPILLLTGDPFALERHAGDRVVGLSKPFEPDVLLTIVQRLVAR